MLIKKLTPFVISTLTVVTFAGSQPVFAADSQTDRSDGIQVITDFDTSDFVTLTYDISNKPSEKSIQKALPTEITVYLNGSDQPSEIPVTWKDKTGNYSTSDNDSYGFEPVWDDSKYALEAGDEMPVAWVKLVSDSSTDTSNQTDAQDDGDSQTNQPSTQDNTAAPTDQPSTQDNTAAPTDPTADQNSNADTSDQTALQNAGDDASAPEPAQSSSADNPDSYILLGDEDTTANRDQIFQYLTGTMGLNSAAACGVMANIERESGFRADIGHMETDGLMSFGICQWHATRYDNLKSFASERGEDYTSLSTQLDYLYNELKTSYSRVLNNIKSVSNNAAGASSAATTWCLYYEVPANKVAESQNRASRAVDYFWPTYGTGSAASHFSDVSSESYYIDAVNWASDKGITSGTGDSIFSPDKVCTRAEIITFLWRLAGSPQDSSNTGFADVAPSAYYSQAVSWALAKGITDGTDGTHFSPEMTCTRAMIVEFLYRYAGASASQYNIFWDVETDAYYARACTWANNNGITGGTGLDSEGHTLFSPNNECSRAQAVTFLYRYSLMS